MAGPGGRSIAPTVVLAVLGLLAAVTIGAWWTGTAVADGRPVATVIRFTLSLAAGWYYLALVRISRGRSTHPGPR